jgi:hypothetical protein
MDLMSDKAVAYAQIILSSIFMVGYFAIVAIFLLGYVKTPPDWKDAFTALLGVLTAGVGTILGYWFSRQRVSAPPEVVK